VTLLSWLSKAPNYDEKKRLVEEATQSVMQFERRTSEVKKLADDVMKVMHHHKGRGFEET